MVCLNEQLAFELINSSCYQVFAARCAVDDGYDPSTPNVACDRTCNGVKHTACMVFVIAMRTYYW